MAVKVALICMLTANGAGTPYWGACNGPEHLIAQCMKAPSEWWEHLKISDMIWARVDKNTFCLKAK